MRSVAFVVLALLLEACGGGGGSPPSEDPTRTIADAAVYLVQGHCPDGSPPLGCSSAAPQRASEQMYWRRHDWPLPGYQIEDSVVSDDGSYHLLLRWINDMAAEEMLNRLAIVSWDHRSLASINRIRETSYSSSFAIPCFGPWA